MRSKYLKVLNVLLIALLSPLGKGCSDSFFGYLDCSQCYYDAPLYYFLDIDVTITHEQPYVPIRVYAGDYRDAEILVEDTARSSRHSIYLRVDRDYTVEATYSDLGRAYIAIGGTRIRTRLETESCGEPCFLVYDNNIDLRKRY